MPTVDEEARSRTYIIGTSRLRIIQGDITTSECEVLVSSDDINLSMGGGVSLALLNAAGPAMRYDAWKQVHNDARRAVPPQLGDVVVTSAGDLAARYIFHAVTLDWTARNIPSGVLARAATLRVLELLPRLQCTSVAFPAIGTGVANLDYAVVAAEMTEVVVDFLMTAAQSFYVEIYIFDRAGRRRESSFFSEFEGLIDSSLTVREESNGNYKIEAPDRTDIATGSSQAAVNEWMRHYRQRRAELELAYVRCRGQGSDGEDAQVLKRALEELESVAKSISGVASAADNPSAVFLSSTQSDLRPHRQAATATLRKLGRPVEWMEAFVPERAQPGDVVTRKVRACGCYLGILGMRYGSVDLASGKSFTELEYDAAVTSGREMRIFVLSRAGANGEMFDDDPDKYRQQLEFRARAMSERTVVLFSSVNELKKGVRLAFSG